MSSIFEGPPVSALAARWWALVIRGVAAIGFGLAAIVWPGISLLVLLVLWGAYAICDGVLGLVLAARVAHAGRRWGWLALEGLVGIAAGVLTFFWPGMTALVLLAVIAVWAIGTGLFAIAAAIRLRKQIHDEWLLAASGVLSIGFGVLLLATPGAGALALVWIIGGYAMVFGVMLVGLGLRLNQWRRSSGEREIPSGGTPSAA